MHVCDMNLNPESHALFVRNNDFFHISLTFGKAFMRPEITRKDVFCHGHIQSACLRNCDNKLEVKRPGN